MGPRRVERLNSLLREVISDVIAKEVRHPDVAPFTSVTRVEISKDLRHAKVFISVLGTPQERKKSVAALTEAARFIGHAASQQVVMRFFPELIFKVDDSVDKQMRIEEILADIEKERSGRDSSG